MSARRAEEVAGDLFGRASALEACPGEKPTVQLKYAAAQAHLDVAAAARHVGRKRMDATLTAIRLTGRTAYVVEVGESCAYLLRSGSIRKLTPDRSVTPRPMKDLLAQAMGEDSAVQVALGRLDLRDRDCLLLCSDGLTAHVSDEELRDAVFASSTLTAGCEALVSLANERGGEDNITVVLAVVGGDLPSADAGDRSLRSWPILDTFLPTSLPPRGVARSGCALEAKTTRLESCGVVVEVVTPCSPISS
jgi:hypothetical protein